MSPCKRVRVSITQLAAFACRRGDLSTDAVVGPTAREGMLAHKSVQKKRKETTRHPDCLESESSVKCECKVADHRLILGGRIDLLDTRTPVLSEIKTTYVPAEQVPDSQQSLHWAQLYLYGYVYLEQLISKSLDTTFSLDESSDADVMTINSSDRPPRESALEPLTCLTLELIYINIRGGMEDGRSESSEIRKVPICELLDYGHSAVQCYAQWLSLVSKCRERMVSTAIDLAFPFDRFRPGQRDMAAAVYRASRDARRLMCEAPTGIGKTISSLYPAIKSLGEGTVNQLVYLTAKVAGRQSAEQAVRRLSNVGLQITMLQIRAKQTTCFCLNGRCERDAAGRCPMTLGFYDRLPAAREELLRLGVIENEKLDEIAWQHQLCPFELVQQLLPWVQLVVADYNYVFDPLVRFAFFASSGKNTLLLIDEAHNLVDRGRAMYSARLDRLQCMSAATACRQTHPALARELDKLSSQMLGVVIAEATGYHVSRDAPLALSRSVGSVLMQMTEASTPPQLLDDSLRELWLALCRFAVINELFSDEHRLIVENAKHAGKRQVQVSLFCVDASRALSASYDMFRSLVFFSATLRPGPFYRDTLGLDENTGYLQLVSPFHSANCLRCVVDWIDTRYRQRQNSMKLLVELINLSTIDRPGNYLVFFSSYAYLEQVHSLFIETYPGRDTWIQSRGQAKKDQQQLLDQLDSAGHRVGFAIQGGVFGEGIDYKGERLVGTLIVGTGLPAVDWHSELMAEHYRESGHDGYEFAYRYPGFTRVLQTAGRVIRNESDRGFVLLVDARFRQSAYQALFPADWKMQYPRNSDELLELLHQFWKNDNDTAVTSHCTDKPQ